MTEKQGMAGFYEIEARDAKTNELIKRWEIKNLLMSCNASFRDQMLLGTYSGTLTDFQIKYIAIGTGNTTPSEDDTQLANEVFRKQITRITNPEVGSVVSVVSLGASEANYFIQEIGIFCGSGATATANSGLMLSRILFPFEKNTNIVLNIVRTDRTVLS